MRIGFAPAGARDAATAVDLARRAEEHGLAELWLSEDYLERAAFAVTSSVAAVTERIGIGIGVINPWTRHVAVTAMECAALAEIARGRLTVGLGASNRAWMENQLGIPFRRPVSALLDFGTGLRTLLAGEELDREIADMAVRARLSFIPPAPGPTSCTALRERRRFAGAPRPPTRSDAFCAVLPHTRPGSAANSSRGG